MVVSRGVGSFISKSRIGGDLMRYFATALVLLVCSNVTAGSISIPGDLGDGGVEANGWIDGLDGPALRVGSGGDDERGHAAVFFFELLVLSINSTDEITSAQIDLTYLGFAPFSFPQYVPTEDGDLYGIGGRSTATVLPADYYDGSPTIAPDTLIEASILTPTTDTGVLNLSTTGSSNLLTFVRSLYDPTGMPVENFAVFRVNMAIDVIPDSGDLYGYDLASAENVDNGGANIPQLTITVVPEPSSMTMVIVGALMLFAVAWRRCRP